ncbi:hypothetical protein VSS74_04540 [Conexibacter stalactiti]|uniref:Uncharacterized protein n=1 Tax=Conexibacter stalactiti TaxID=1940611 RepID=A0ABU4HJV4_9ACTN|nr:hypothetical protein [Conexibacter stalactiti]MDW5593590.1 hypothetical protein [Conexibacter stalactiti]MEC5034231.1 hypothetical protein [Conexibacter stalactiti]
MGARARQRGSFLTALAAGVALATLTAPAAAAAQEPPQPRTATIADAADPGVVYDLAALNVVLDPAAGTLAIALDLHLPPPLPPAVDAATVTVRLASNAVADGGTSCRVEPPAAPGDVVLTLATDPLDGTLTASATIAPDPLPRPLTVDRSPDGARISLALTDPLLAQAAPRCAEAVARGRSDGLPDDPGEHGDDALAGWFDGQRPVVEPPPPRPLPDAPAAPSGGAPVPPSAPTTPQSTARRPTEGGACRRSGLPALEWEPFPRELAARGTALVPVQARRGRRVSDLVATLTTVRGGRAVGEPSRISLPPRGYALQLRAPAEPGRLDVVLSWVEQRDGVDCPQRSRRISVAVVRALEPRLSIARESDPARLTLAWGARGHDCHALAERPLSVRLEGLGYVRGYRVDDPCAEWSTPGMALPDVAAQRAGETLRLTPRGDEPGSWSYRLTAKSGRRTVASGFVVVTVDEQDGAVVRSIRFVADGEAARRRGRR